MENIEQIKLKKNIQNELFVIAIFLVIVFPWSPTLGEIKVLNLGDYYKWLGSTSLESCGFFT